MSFRFKPLIIPVLLLSLLFYGCSQSGGSQAGAGESPESATHLTLNTDYYSVEYPAGWEKVEQGALISFRTSQSGPDDTFLDNVVVDLSQAQAGLTLDEHVEGAIEALPGAISDFNLLEVGFAKLSGIDARRLVYTGSSGSASLKFTQVIAISDGIMYVITYSAAEDSYSDYLGELYDILSSFVIKQQGKSLVSGSDTGGVEAEDSSNVAEEESGQSQVQQVSQGAEAGASAVKEVSGSEQRFIGLWRIYSEAIFYDAGGSNWLDTPSTRKLELKQDRTWNFGSSSGTWAVSGIVAQDWERWGVSDYGPDKKLTLYGWNDDAADGPVEESSGSIDFFWVIYRTGPPAVSSPSQVQMKFGKSDLSQ